MRIIKEPLFHFILFGIAIFGWFYLISPEREAAEEAEKISISDGDIELLSTRFETSWKRVPSEAELQVLIDALIREEVLVREARKLGLDRGDQVIRARLAQKMDFLTGAIASSVTPEDAVLQTYLEDNSARFTTPHMVAFDQVYLGDAPDPEKVAKALAELSAGEDWLGLGVPSLLQRTMPLSTPGVIASNFGGGFSKNLENLEPMVWVGPIQSGFGEHLVRVTDLEPGRLPPLDDVRDVVLTEWRREAGEDLAQVQYESFAASYEIETPITQEGGQ
ncbi:peptidyl-prolyl cis-trans isomerase [Rhodobacteraceae bacterium B1Z28]|uniref:Peptidyl-prolyl cis-trans isomerase n=1 Tax=Ruegeria haliotis TaxID=2747601 RepID=A0ABX2PVM7_9RHOB|nr:peptidylprolyl isomerase [Ruegeria haliotis]NVO58230.1 peptidyl-prolyl cis-trans isomerase [Ruegeria haliotis]